MTRTTAATGLRKDPLWTFKTVGAFVPKATARAFEAHGFHAAELILNWSAIVGADLARFTAPRRIRWPKAPDRLGDATGASRPAPPTRGGNARSALEIWVEGGRAHEIPYLKAPIIQRINSYFGYRAITDLIPISGAVSPAAEPAAKHRRASAEAIAREQQTLALQPDDPLAQALARLGANVAARAARAGRT
jgi:hypothetical protein